MNYVLNEISREIRMSQADEKTDQELYRLDPESSREDSASILVPVEGAKVNVSEEVESIDVIFDKEITEFTPETVVISFGNSEVIDLSGNGSNEVILTASKNLIVG